MNIDKTKLGFDHWFEDENGNRVCKDDPSATMYICRKPGTVVEEYDEYCYHPKHPFIKFLCRKSQRFHNRMTKKYGKTFRSIYRIGTTFNGGQDVIVAMVNSGDYTLIEAIDLWTRSCGRCMNVLAYEYLDGKDGYPEHSEEWNKCNTVCEFCKGEWYNGL